MTGLNELRDQAHATAVEKGWWEPQPHDGVYVHRTFGDLIALVHEEASEALREHRNGHEPTHVSYSYSVIGYSGPNLESHDGHWHANGTRITPENAAELGLRAEPHGIPIELADVIIRVLDIAGWYGIDIEKAVAEKMAHNTTRPYRHGGKKL